MNFAWFIARRYLTARRRQAFISLISAVSILGVGVGVMALIIALALMTGVQTELRDRIVGSTAHVYVYNNRAAPFEDSPQERAKWLRPGIIGVSPSIINYAQISFHGGNPKAVTLKGIDPAHEPDVTDIGTSMTTGSLDALVNRQAPSPDAVVLDGIVLGEELAKSLGVHAGDVVDIVSAVPTRTLIGFAPHYRPYTVVGTFKFGFYEIDDSWALISLESAEQVFDLKGPDLMELKLAHVDDAAKVRDQLSAELGPDYKVQDWASLNQALYSALFLEKLAISLTIGLIVMVAALNIVASLVLLVMEKTRDIAILRTMGAPARVIRRIFLYQGLAIGALGTGAGTGLGLIVCYVADRYQLIKLPADVYQITHLAFRVHATDVAVVVVSAMVVCLLATMYPSRQAGRIDPAEALRNQ